MFSTMILSGVHGSLLKNAKCAVHACASVTSCAPASPKHRKAGLQGTAALSPHAPFTKFPVCLPDTQCKQASSWMHSRRGVRRQAYPQPTLQPPPGQFLWRQLQCKAKLCTQPSLKARCMAGSAAKCRAKQLESSQCLQQQQLRTQQLAQELQSHAECMLQACMLLSRKATLPVPCCKNLVRSHMHTCSTFCFVIMAEAVWCDL